jgi:tetratricopeptide (TPR) repeat protein
MKKNYPIIGILLLFTGTIQSQKTQIKSAEKEVNSGNPQDALTILKSVEYQVYNSKDEEKALFYFVQGNALLALADKNVDEGENLTLAAQSYQELIKIESESGKSSFSSQAKSNFKSLKEKLVKNAMQDARKNKHIESANMFYEAYLLDQKDTINLYNTASAFVIGKDFISALKHYERLKAINYSGTGKFYYAINKTTKTEERFLKIYDRDNSINASTHEKPRNEIGLSKRGLIYKNIALIYFQNGDNVKAKKAISDARNKNPEDNSLALAETELCLESKDYVGYKKLATALFQKNPNDFEVIYNLGVLSAKANNLIEAENFYTKAISIDPKDIKAYIDLYVLKLESIKPINEDMYKLGTSPIEMKKYDMLKAKKEEIYKSTIPYLKKAIEIDPKDIEISQSLLSVYNALEMTAEYNELKAKLS